MVIGLLALVRYLADLDTATLVFYGLIAAIVGFLVASYFLWTGLDTWAGQVQGRLAALEGEQPGRPAATADGSVDETAETDS